LFAHCGVVLLDNLIIANVGIYITFPIITDSKEKIQCFLKILENFTRKIEKSLDISVMYDVYYNL